MKELQEARERQELEKANALVEQMKKDRDELMKVIKKQREEEQAEKLLEEERRKILYENAKEVR